MSQTNGKKRDVCSTAKKNCTPTINRENNSFTLNEKFDNQKLVQFLNAGVIDDSYCRSIKKYIKYSKRHDKNIFYNKVSYTVPENGLGRFKIRINKIKDDPNKSCMTQSNMWNELKSMICGDIYYDVDIVNCQATIMEQLMIRNGITNKYINIYNTNRDELFKSMEQKFKINRKEIKSFIYGLLFGGGNSELKKHNIEFKDLPIIIKNLIKELKVSSIKLLQLNPIYKQEAIIKKEEKYWNINGVALSLLLQTEERKVLTEMYKYFTLHGFKIGACIHDGVHIEKDIRLLNQEELEKCENHIKDKLDYDIKIKIKDFQNIVVNKMPIVRNFKLLNKDYIDILGIKINHINTPSICPYNGSPFENINIYDGEKVKDIILIKSSTGSGKSYFLKKVKEEFNTNKKNILKMIEEKPTQIYDYYENERDIFDDMIEYNSDDEEEEKSIKILSLVSRVSLSHTHEIEYNLVNYQKVKEHGLNEVYQLDSIEKFVNPNNDKYILFLDEVASLCSHFNNKMDKMSRKRIEMVDKFKRIINDKNCLQIIGCDDNLNDGTLKFIRQLTNKKIHLYINDHKNDFKIPVNVCIDIDYSINAIKQTLAKNEKIFCCSNLNGKFFKTVVLPIIKELKLKKNEYKIYSGTYGEKMNNIINSKQGKNQNEINLDDPEFEKEIFDHNEKIITDCWNDKELKIIFTTPSIIYGLSYDLEKTHHIYGFYFNNSPLDAMSCNQQINRIRKPISINLYIENAINYSYLTLEQAENRIMEQNEDIVVNKKFSKVQAAINDLYIYDCFSESHLCDLFYYIPQLLKIKGYTNIKYNIDDHEKQDKYTSKKVNKIIIEEYNNKILDEKKMDDMTIKLNTFGFNSNYVKNNEELLKKENTFKSQIMEIFADNAKYRTLNLYNNCINKYYLEKLDTNNDTLLNKTYSDDYKLKLLDDLHTVLKIKWFDINLLEKLENNPDLLKPIKVDDELYNRICHNKRFRVTSKKKPKLYIDWIIFLIKRYTMFSIDIIINKDKNFYYNKERYSIPVLNSELINKFDSIAKYKNKVDNIKNEKYKQIIDVDIL